MTSKNDELQVAWQSLGGSPYQLDIRTIKSKASSFERKIRSRNLREFAAAALVFAIFGGHFATATDMLTRVACVLVILAAVFVTGLLYVQGREGEASTLDLVEPCLKAHRRAITRQRNLLASVWCWYLMPFVPGALLFPYAMSLGSGMPWLQWGVSAVIFGGIALLNHFGAKKLQMELDSLPHSD